MKFSVRPPHTWERDWEGWGGQRGETQLRKTAVCKAGTWPLCVSPCGQPQATSGVKCENDVSRTTIVLCVQAQVPDPGIRDQEISNVVFELGTLAVGRNYCFF